MAKHTRQADVEYKETVAFELFPTLEYDKAQKQWLISFHAFKNNIRRIINYAAQFKEEVCTLFYIFGVCSLHTFSSVERVGTMV